MPTVIGKDERLYYRATCGNCASILQYVKAEVAERIERDYGGGTDVVHYIECPSCRKEVVVRRY